jgi:hypothetical protein
MFDENKENGEVEKISWSHHEISQAKKKRHWNKPAKLLHNQQNESVTKKKTHYDDTL